jgi:hypothetical protein
VYVQDETYPYVFDEVLQDDSLSVGHNKFVAAVAPHVPSSKMQVTSVDEYNYSQHHHDRMIQ